MLQNLLRIRAFSHHLHLLEVQHDAGVHAILAHVRSNEKDDGEAPERYHRNDEKHLAFSVLLMSGKALTQKDTSREAGAVAMELGVQFNMELSGVSV